MYAAQGKSCARCGGSGVVLYSSEYPDFEDRRACPECEAGKALAAKIAEIMAHV